MSTTRNMFEIHWNTLALKVQEMFSMGLLWPQQVEKRIAFSNFQRGNVSFRCSGYMKVCMTLVLENAWVWPGIICNTEEFTELAVWHWIDSNFCCCRISGFHHTDFATLWRPWAQNLLNFFQENRPCLMELLWIKARTHVLIEKGIHREWMNYTPAVKFE